MPSAAFSDRAKFPLSPRLNCGVTAGLRAAPLSGAAGSWRDADPCVGPRVDEFFGRSKLDVYLTGALGKVKLDRQGRIARGLPGVGKCLGFDAVMQGLDVGRRGRDDGEN